MNFSYKFPVVKGVQAGKNYFIAMVPLKMIERLFPKGDEFVLPEYRAQRKLNEARIPEIRDYILNNRDSYVFSALAASIDGEYSFMQNDQSTTGILEVSMDARFLINDGQHRMAAILEAIKEAPELGNETISVVFYEDLGLKRSQQMFTDLNKHAVKTSNSIAELYDSRDTLAVATRDMVLKVPFLNEYVDKEKDILGKFSSSLFTLNTFYTANKRILKRKKCDDNFKQFIIKYWTSISLHMIPWRELEKKELSKIELREQYIASQAVTIQAFGRVGASLFEYKNIELEKILIKIEKVNWRRNANDWQGRVIRNDGKLLTNNEAIILMANYLKQQVGLDLTDEELYSETKFIKGRR